ncbi:adh short, KR, and/or NAD binding 10 domain containing protein [Asbolus verrucosus]|uniref:Adh short, KR, and/or NAD binding 10 domain containing protein n=1 Tax=Asbolus verrucosus TaxID=1661398 RepID=A0A482VUW6_ASBVE|nr:adh short, KR, and/or NAD binding 10 domain containing protein [Asbolus verrucosus]
MSTIARGKFLAMVLSLDRWRGKTAVITGAGAGIGTAIAAKLVEKGLQVADLSHRVEELSKKLEGKTWKLHALRADISKEEDILQAFSWVADNLGPLHIPTDNVEIGQDNRRRYGKVDEGIEH